MQAEGSVQILNLRQERIGLDWRDDRKPAPTSGSEGLPGTASPKATRLNAKQSSNSPGRCLSRFVTNLNYNRLTFFVSPPVLGLRMSSSEAGGDRSCAPTALTSELGIQ
jgi:hypothetical protein